jgi:hypothetical protein
MCESGGRFWEWVPGRARDDEGMARYSKVPAPLAKLAFLAALRRGALVVEAAAEAGVAVGSFYRWRRSDPAFDAEWSAAAAASSWAYEKRPGEAARLVRTKRRVRFAGGPRPTFLAGLAQTCSTEDSARRAGVHPATVRRHARRDPAFARDCREALETGYAALELRLEAEQEAARRRPLAEIAEEAGPAPDFDEAFERLLRLERPRPRRQGRDEMIATLERRLRHAFGISDGGPAAGEAEAPDRGC